MSAGVPDFSVSDYRPGALGRVCEMQAAYYAREWGFGRAFETKVATEMASFLDRFDPARDLFKIAEGENGIAGAVTLDGGESEAAHLRWFIVDGAARGSGLGRRLLDLAISFARAREFGVVTLWTFDGLDAARHLYESAGFTLVEARQGTSWGTEVTEQRFELQL